MKGGSILHVHVVQKGDTLWKIAKQYGVSFDEVKRLNAHLANPDYVVPGMKIFVPKKPANGQATEHPYTNDRPVKKNKEEYTIEPAPKPTSQPVPQSIPKPMPLPQPVPKPTMQPKPQPSPIPQAQPQPQPTMQPPPQPLPQPIPQPMPQPTMQPMPQPMPISIPINQHLSMTQMMPPYMGIPYGWIPVPDMDFQHPPQALPTPQAPPQAKPMPAPAPLPKPMPATKEKPPHGWQLLDSSSLREIETSSLELPTFTAPPQHHQQPDYYQPENDCPPDYYQPQQDFQPYHHQPSPCGCGKQNYVQPTYGQNHYQPQTLGENQDQYSMMPQHMMMAPQMSPYMACTPCQMWPAPQGQWGYPTHFRYY